VPPQTTVIFNANIIGFPAHRPRPRFDAAIDSFSDRPFLIKPGIEINISESGKFQAGEETRNEFSRIPIKLYQLEI
jgi:hypothetical protein